MRTLITVASLALSLLTAVAQEAVLSTREFTAGGEKLKVVLRTFNPPVVITRNAARMNQATAVNASHLYYAALADGDIAKAQRLSNDPKSTYVKQTQHKMRLGESGFKAMHGDYFGGRVSVKYEFAIDRHFMLIVHDDKENMDLAQFFELKNNIFVLDDWKSKEKDQLARLFQSLKNADGIVTLP